MQNTQGRSSRRRYVNQILLCALGLLINFLGASLVKAFNWSLYLDNIGSALVAALGGFVPGILVGFLTNLINSVYDYNTAYYGLLTVLIAVASAWFARRDYYNKPSRLPIIILTFALIGGGLGSVLTFMLYGLSFGEGFTAPLAHAIYDGSHFGVFWSQFIADFTFDLLDKAITVLLVFSALKLMPQALKDSFYFTNWKQAPLSQRDRREIERRYTERFSLHSKFIIGIAAVMLSTGIVVTYISFMNYRTVAIEEQTDLARGVVKVVSKSIDPERIDDYLKRGEAAPGYLESKAILQNLMDSTENVEFCYVYRILEDGCHVVFDPDTEDTPGMAPGSVVAFEGAFAEHLPDLLAGRPIEPVISDDSYGWLLSIYEPVYDKDGVCQCYACVDINMGHIQSNGYQFMARVISLFLSFFILVLTIGLWVADYNVILPINAIAHSSSQFAFDSEEVRKLALSNIERLDIHTGDEIENLYHAVVKTMQDVTGFIGHTQEQNEKIRKLQNGLILVLADMVENRDKNTGDHVRKTAAYTRIIMNQLKAEGIYTDQLTEEFMDDVENSAPLHDVGKIQVSDTILNKPGKLTDEEFEIMKTHTTAGARVIAQAMAAVSDADSSYLKEAQNLAHYHHEKWNGRGYPCGLKGEEIPLSARIMAVADVFDALVSRRSYKDRFSFEKAMDIIREGSGSHFDPKIATAFEHASDEVRRVMEIYMGD